MVLKHLIIGLLLSFLSWNVANAQESYNRLIFEGNRSFNNKDYENSVAKFKEAVKQKNNDFAAHYNLGNAYYKKKMYEEARTEYQKAQNLAQTIPDKSAALYNLGNAYMKDKKPEKAAELYKQALKYSPYNETIRKNYEIAKLKDKEKQNRQNKEQNKKGGGGNEGKQNDSPKDDQKGKAPQQQGNGQSPDQQQGEGNGNNPKEENGAMPKDLEDAILNRVSSKERETARRILNKNSYSTPASNDKDW
ncbi:MAG: tetratricopeptide repeat protein [Bergeyella sp.]